MDPNARRSRQTKIPAGEVLPYFSEPSNDYQGTLIDNTHVKQYYCSSIRRFELLVSTVCELQAANAVVLEVGSGYGFTLLALRQMGYDVIAAELPESIEIYSKALRGAGVRVVPWDMHKSSCPIPEGSVDVVIASEVLEHLQMSLSSAVRALIRPLRAGGALVVTTPNIYRARNITRILCGENICEPFPGEPHLQNGVVIDSRHHPREPTLRELRASMEENGLRVGCARRFCAGQRRFLQNILMGVAGLFEEHLLVVGRSV